MHNRRNGLSPYWDKGHAFLKGSFIISSRQVSLVYKNEVNPVIMLITTKTYKETSHAFYSLSDFNSTAPLS